MIAIAGCAGEQVPQAPADSQAPTGQDDGTAQPDDGTTQEQPEDSTAEEQPDVTINVEGVNYDFIIDGEENPTITVNEGDLVRIEFTSKEGFHDFVIDEFDAATEQLSAGGGTMIEFVADQSGTFDYYCSVGSHRELGMEGQIVVQ